MALTTSYAEEAAVYEFSYTTGNDTYVMAGAWSTHLPFSARYPAGATELPYYATDGSSGVGSQFEIGIGNYDVGSNTLTRLTILASSNDNAAVNWSGRTRILIRPLMAAFPLCPTPPLNGEALVWDAVNQEWCPGCPVCPTPVTIPGVHIPPASSPPPTSATILPLPDGQAIGWWSTSHSSLTSGFLDGIATANLTTANAPDVIVIYVMLAGASFSAQSAGAAVPVPAVTGITGNGLTFISRGRATTLAHSVPISGISFYGYISLEEWYAIAPIPLTNAQFTATFAGPAPHSFVSVNSFKNVGLPQIWDPNPALPFFQVNLPGSQFTTTISTTDAGAQLPIVAIGNHISAFFPLVSSSWANLAHAGIGGDGSVFGASEVSGSISGPLSGVVLAPYGSIVTSANGFIIMADALVGS